MRAVEDIPASRPIWYMDAKAFNADYSSDAEYVCQIRIPVSRLSRTMEPMAKTPVTYIAPLFSHAIYERYGEHMSSGEYVVASININLRPYFTAASLRPFCTPVYLAYNRILGDYPFNTVLMSQKKLLEAQLKTDALAYSAQRMISDVDLAMEHLPAQRAAAFMSLHDKIDSKSTYSISRVGNVTMPEQMQRYVTDLYPVHPCGGQAFAMTVINYRGELVVTVSGKNDLDSVTRRFVELLNENGIYSFMSDRFDLSSK